jgi:hypothetical protein
MTYGIIGVGAVGGSVLGGLARTRIPALAIARWQTAAALRAGGLNLATPEGAWRLSVPVADEHDELPVDDLVVLLTTKVQDADAALRSRTDFLRRPLLSACRTGWRLSGWRYAASTGRTVPEFSARATKPLPPRSVLARPRCWEARSWEASRRVPTSSSSGSPPNLAAAGFTARVSDGVMRAKYAKTALQLGKPGERPVPSWPRCGPAARPRRSGRHPVSGGRLHRP